MTEIEDELFYNLKKLYFISLPPSIISIGQYAFYGCESLNINEYQYRNLSDLEIIGEKAFYGCTSLTEVLLPYSLKEIGKEAFRGCTKIQTLDGCPTFFNCAEELNMGIGVFQGCTGLTEVTIPFLIKSISEMAFYGCKGITKLSIPVKCVSSIGDKAFYGCSGLTKLDLYGVKSIGNQAFYGCSGLTKLDLYGVKSIGNQAFAGCKGLTELVIPSSVECIGKEAFSNCSGLTSLEIQNGVKEIGNGAFYKCINITGALVLPNSLTVIENRAFDCLYKINTIYLGKNVTAIKGYAFAGSLSLTSVTIPSSVTEIGDFAFSTDNYRKPLTIYSNITNPFPIEENTFARHSDYENATLVIPYGTRQKYESVEYWNHFQHIEEKLEPDTPIGDLTGDNEVDGLDLVALVRIILSGVQDLSGDFNGDGVVDGVDYVAMVNFILNAAFSRSIEVAETCSKEHVPNINIDVEPFSIAAGESREMAITLQNPDVAVTMVQMDMTLPKGLTLSGDYTLERTDKTKHQLFMGGSDTQRRLLLASGRNATLVGDEGTIMRLTVTADETFNGGDIVFSNLLCAAPDLQTAQQPSFTVSLGDATGIGDIKGDVNQHEIYNLSGQRLNVPQKGVNIVNGKKITIK